MEQLSGAEISLFGGAALRTREDQNRWLEEWYDWFHRVERYLKLDPEASISYQQCAYLIVAIDRDAVAGELFSTQLPPGEAERRPGA